MPAPSRRVVRLSLIAIVVAVAVASWWPTPATQRAVTTTTYDVYGLRGHPTAGQQHDATSAYANYRRYVVTAAQSFSTDTTALCDAGEAGNLAAARASWRLAQMDYDRLRARISDRSTTELTIDGLLASQPFYVGRQGLHALEEDLFGGTVSRLRGDCLAMPTDGVSLTFGLSHTVATPSGIAQDAVTLLTWMNERVIAQPQEVFAQSEATDSFSVVHSVATWWSYERPLVATLNETLVTAMDRAVAVVLADQAVIGGPDTRDRDVPAGRWPRLAHDGVHLATLWTTVASQLFGFGAGRTYA